MKYKRLEREESGGKEKPVWNLGILDLSALQVGEGGRQQLKFLGAQRK